MSAAAAVGHTPIIEGLEHRGRKTEDDMARYENGMQVGGGYYFNASKWEVEVVPNEGGTLHGGAGAKYLKVPFPVLFVIVPTLGALFLMFLPLIGFVMFAQAIAKKVASLVTHGATDLAATVQPGSFAAGNAYFAGKPEEKKEEGAAPASPELEKLEKEIQGRKEPK
jgi:hypothetical protein